MVNAATAPVAIAEEVGELKARHEELERQLAVLDRHLHLSAEEQLQRTRLKKEKLWVKDRLVRLESQATARAG